MSKITHEETFAARDIAEPVEVTTTETVRGEEIYLLRIGGMGIDYEMTRDEAEGLRNALSMALYSHSRPITDTIEDTEPQPTPEPWEVKQGTVLPQSKRGKIKHIASLMAPAPSALDESEANGKLIAAAGTAAHEAAEMGYDPQKAVEGLPQLIEAAEEGSHIKVQAVLAAMRGAEGSGDE